MRPIEKADISPAPKSELSYARKCLYKPLKYVETVEKIFQLSYDLEVL